MSETKIDHACLTHSTKLSQTGSLPFVALWSGRKALQNLFSTNSDLRMRALYWKTTLISLFFISLMIRIRFMGDS